jgi:hypothetical protein
MGVKMSNNTTVRLVDSSNPQFGFVIQTPYETHFYFSQELLDMNLRISQLLPTLLSPYEQGLVRRINEMQSILNGTHPHMQVFRQQQAAAAQQENVQTPASSIQSDSSSPLNNSPADEVTPMTHEPPAFFDPNPVDDDQWTSFETPFTR